jgi:hypothetical protein
MLPAFETGERGYQYQRLREHSRKAGGGRFARVYAFCVQDIKAQVGIHAFFSY